MFKKIIVLLCLFTFFYNQFVMAGGGNSKDSQGYFPPNRPQVTPDTVIPGWIHVSKVRPEASSGEIFCSVLKTFVYVAVIGTLTAAVFVAGPAGWATVLTLNGVPVAGSALATIPLTVTVSGVVIHVPVAIVAASVTVMKIISNENWEIGVGVGNSIGGSKKDDSPENRKREEEPPTLPKAPEKTVIPEIGVPMGDVVYADDTKPKEVIGILNSEEIEKFKTRPEKLNVKIHQKFSEGQIFNTFNEKDIDKDDLNFLKRGCYSCSIKKDSEVLLKEKVIVNEITQVTLADFELSCTKNRVIDPLKFNDKSSDIPDDLSKLSVISKPDPFYFLPSSVEKNMRVPTKDDGIPDLPKYYNFESFSQSSSSSSSSGTFSNPLCIAYERSKIDLDGMVDRYPIAANIKKSIAKLNNSFIPPTRKLDLYKEITKYRKLSDKLYNLNQNRAYQFVFKEITKDLINEGLENIELISEGLRNSVYQLNIEDIQLAREVADCTTDLIPIVSTIKDTYGLISITNPITGKELTDQEYIDAALSLLTDAVSLGITRVKNIPAALKLIDKIKHRMTDSQNLKKAIRAMGHSIYDYDRIKFKKRSIYLKKSIFDPNQKFNIIIADKQGQVRSMTNIDLIKAKRSPRDIDGNIIHLHHLTQHDKEVSTLLTISDINHRKYTKDIHRKLEAGEKSFRQTPQHDRDFTKLKHDFWDYLINR